MKKVLELPAFRRLLVAAVLNELGLSVAAVALAVLVYRQTGSALGAAAFFLCAQFGPALLSPFVVARLDQRDVRGVLVRLYALEGVIFAILAWLVGRFALAPVLALALVDGVLAGAARVIARAAWASDTGSAGLMREASAVMNTSLSVCYMVGPALGGVIVAASGTRGALLVNVGAFALITVVIATAHGLPAAAPDRAPTTGRLRAAIAIARGEPLIRRLLSLQAIGMVFFTMSIPIEVVFAQRTLHAGAKGYGVLLSAWGAGAIVGSGVYARWRALPSRSLITLGSFLLALGFAVMVIAHSLLAAAIGAAISGVGNTTELVAMRTALQESVSDRWMALIVSLSESIIQAAPGAGILLGGAVTALAGPRAGFAVAAAGSLVVGAAAWVRPNIGVAQPVPTVSPAAPKSDQPLTAAVPRQ